MEYNPNLQPKSEPMDTTSSPSPIPASPLMGQATFQIGLQGAPSPVINMNVGSLKTENGAQASPSRSSSSASYTYADSLPDTTGFALSDFLMQLEDYTPTVRYLKNSQL